MDAIASFLHYFGKPMAQNNFCIRHIMFTIHATSLTSIVRSGGGCSHVKGVGQVVGKFSSTSSPSRPQSRRGFPFENRQTNKTCSEAKSAKHIVIKYFHPFTDFTTDRCKPSLKYDGVLKALNVHRKAGIPPPDHGANQNAYLAYCIKQNNKYVDCIACEGKVNPNFFTSSTAAVPGKF